MSFSGIMDVGINMAFLYLLLSLMCTTINEIIATALSLRSRSLSSALATILDNQTIFENFYNHGLIRGAMVSSSGGAKNESDSKTAPPTDPVPAPKIDPVANQNDLNNGPKSANIPKTAHSSYLDSRTFALALLDSLDPSKPIPVISDIEETASKLPAGTVRDIVTSAIVTADGDITKVRDNIAQWFDTTMDRLGGEYKRQVRLISFVVGVIMAVAVNADSFAVGHTIWTDETLRNQIAQIAETDAKANYDKTVTGCVKAAQDNAPQATEGDLQSDALDCRIKLLPKEAEQLRPFPIGWAAINYPTGLLAGASFWGTKAIGWLWTGLALSLGAPFWFDLLQKFINIRGTGKKPRRALRTN